MTDNAAGLGTVLDGQNHRLCELAAAPVLTVFHQVHSSPRGLTENEAADRLSRFGDNDPAPDDEDTAWTRLRSAVRSPFVALLAGLDVVFLLVRDIRGAGIVGLMIALAVLLRLWQQTRSERATRALAELVSSTVTVRRRADDDDEPMEREVSPQDLVPGDIVLLSAGDVVAADVRLITSTDLVVDQSVLSGESLPVSKSARLGPSAADAGLRDAVVDAPNLCLSGTAVVAGAATGVVIATGPRTYTGSLTRSAAAIRPESSFDRGVRAVGWTLIRFMLVMAPIVFVVNGLVSGVWAQAAMFAVAVAVGLTPEMLPVIVTTNLARGGARLVSEKVVVRRLNAIQDLGGMDVLCVDKTGTLTEDRIIYAHSIDVAGRPDEAVAEFAYLSVYFQDCAHSPLDAAVLELLGGGQMEFIADAAFTKVDEVAFNHRRRRNTVVVTRQRDEHIMICKGDPDQVLARCSQIRIDNAVVAFDDELAAEAHEIVAAYRRQGMRVLAVAVKELPARWEDYGDSDEFGLVLVGFVGFVDPIRESAAGTVTSLADHGVGVKILTGDSRVVAAQAANHVGLDSHATVLGSDIDDTGDHELRALAVAADVFAELAPAHKARIVAALRQEGHAVGYLGDGVNDVAALRIADVGIAADTAADVAKQAADLILLERDLAVVARGVVEGRRTLANTMKYIKITASSNFGNVLSVLAASVLLPFLPILPIQLMVQNLLYDTAQLALSWDRVDDDYLRVPQRWRSGGLIGFMLTFGPLSSLFDLATFGALWWWFGGAHAPSLFQTGWFVEGLLTQLLIVLVLRTREVPWRRPGPAATVVLALWCAASIGLVLPVTPLAEPLHMTPLPIGYALWLAVVAVSYASCAQLVKHRYLRRHRAWL
ncbi:magnesium-translocating P-type ATPase [Mycobacterium aquaticum]|uniref:Magnesium-transporting ATPase, P-type 1 n=1 Tax=Mycobacterium aquaticum TaxID=1927124 RepID=A0A1W9ZW70_9MYCO|nr:magnesium-translocating P-type ATPase [Mycobacterium aquaticum]ORA22032.1 magnesium-translocating P-type ATPase [Mycobacterium aquaticum]